MGASSANVTYTGTSKAGLTATTVTHNDIIEINFNIQREIIEIKTKQGFVSYPYDAVATFTWVIAAGVATITIS